jgi:hypothetical protein
VVPAAQISIGRFTVTALADGYADMPFSYFPGRAPEEVEAAARAQSAARPGGVRFVFNSYLVDDGERLVLVDTGPAGALGETGRLPGALEAVASGRTGSAPSSSPTCTWTTSAASSPAGGATTRTPRSTRTGATSPTGPTRPSGRPRRTS